MIELERERLAGELEAKLRRWLQSPESDTLRQVIEAECQFHQATALHKAISARKGDPHDLLAQQEMRDASAYARFLEIFDRIRARPSTEPFHLPKLKPPSRNPLNYANTVPIGNTEDAE